MSETTNDEIDLRFIFKKINELFKNISIGIYNSIQFFLRNWHIVLGLIIAGVLLGIFSEDNRKPHKNATLIMQANYKTALYAYNALNTLSENTRDLDFLAKHGFRTDSVEIKKLEVEPLVDFGDLLKKFSDNEEALTSLLRNVEYQDDETIANSFQSDYKYHEVRVKLSAYGTEETLDKIYSYLNANPLIKEKARVGKILLQDNIAMNEFSIKQIDSAISKYSGSTLWLPSSKNQMVVVDKDFSYDGILIEKAKLQKLNTELKENLIYSNDAFVNINDYNVVEDVIPFYKKRFVLYPILFVFLHVCLILFLKKYKKIKALVSEKTA